MAHPFLQERNKLVREVMRFMIFRQSEKPDVPVPRGDLSKLLAGNKKVSSKLIIKLAQAHFSKSMGLELKELTVPTEKDIRAGQRGASHAKCRLLYELRYVLPQIWGLKCTF